MEKSAVVFFSVKGNTRFVAEIITDEMNADSFEIKIFKKRRPFYNYLKFLIACIFGLKPKIRKIEFHPEKYEKIFIGSPVYWRTFSPVIRSFKKKYPLKNKKVHLFCTYQFSGDRAVRKMKIFFKQNNVLSSRKWKEPIENDEIEQALLIKNWIMENKKIN